MRETVCSGGLSLTVDDLGAEPVSVICNGRERLWQNDNGAWAGHAPVLFPVCGCCNITVNGVRYSVPKHGFARNSRFTLVGKGKDFLRYLLRDSEETRSVYPFPFEFTVLYRVKSNRLEITYEVKNTGDAPFVFSCGAHPCFALDGDVGGYEIVFGRKERFLHSEHDESGYLTGRQRDFGFGKAFPIPAEELKEGRTLIFGDIKSDSVILCKKSGERVAEYRFGGFEHLLLWRPEGAHAICIEPWGNLPGVCGKEEEFAEKRGVTTLNAGKTRKFVQKIRFYGNK